MRWEDRGAMGGTGGNWELMGYRKEKRMKESWKPRGGEGAARGGFPRDGFVLFRPCVCECVCVEREWGVGGLGFFVGEGWHNMRR